MSQTVDVTCRNIRVMLCDLDPAAYAIDTELKLQLAVMRNAQQLAQRAGAATSWVANKLNATAGSLADETIATVATSVAYQRLFQVKDTTNGVILRRVSQDEINAMRAGLTATSGTGGDPTAYAMWEDGSQTLTVRWNVIPTRAIAYDILYQGMVSDVRSIANTLNFSAGMLRAIECATAAELGRGLTDEVMARLGLPADAKGANGLFADWDRFADDGVRLERERKDTFSGRPWGVGAIV